MHERSRATSGRRLVVLSLLAATAASSNAQQTGNVFGTVRIAEGVVANARAILDRSREMRTDSTGRFQFRGVSVGRHVLEVLAIGATPYDVNVIVPANDTLDFEVMLVKTVMLDSVLVEGSTVRQGFARAYEDRKRIGLGRFMDSAEVKKFGEVRQALLFIPGVKAGGLGPRKSRDSVFFSDAMGLTCLPNVWIDKQNWGTDQGPLRTMRPDDVMGIEVYSRSILIPEEFRQQGFDKGCGALVIWTRRLWPQGRRPAPE